MSLPPRPPKKKLSAAQKAKRAERKAARAVLRDSVRHSSLLDGETPADDMPRLRPSAGDRRVPHALRQRVLESLAEQVRFARSHWHRPFRMPSVSFDLRGTTAGTADSLAWHIQLNPVLLVENVERMVGQTSGHELAHLLTSSLYGGAATSHGPHWRSVMVSLGLNPDRTHDMDVMNAQVGKELYKYRCGCRLWLLKPPQHRDASSGRVQHSCKSCSRSLSYTGEVRLNGTWYKDPKAIASGAAAPLVSPGSVRRPAASPPPVPTPVFRRPSASASAAPVAPPAPPARPAAPAPSRAPSPAALRFAWDLARRLHVSLTPAQMADSSALSGFISHAQRLIATGAAGALATSENEPSERQLAFADAIAARRGLTIPTHVRSNRRLLSIWIDTNKG